MVSIYNSINRGRGLNGVYISDKDSLIKGLAAPSVLAMNQTIETHKGTCNM